MKKITTFIVAMILCLATSAQPILFEPKVDFTTGLQPNSVVIGDIDGDAKPDLAMANQDAASVSVLRNTSISGTVSFAGKVDLEANYTPYSISIGDIDGDGKADLVTANWSSNTVAILRNTSTSGTISFAPKAEFSTGPAPRSVSIGDIDGDGKPDLAVTNYNDNTVSVFRNTSSPGTVSFANRVSFGTNPGPYSINIGDIDGDGKLDLAVANQGSATVSVFRNTSTPGTINLVPKIDFTTYSSNQFVSIGDIDGDSKPDLAVASGNRISVLRNTSTAGAVSFEAKIDFTTAANASFSVSVADINGDGKPDLATANYSDNTVSVLRNTSTSGAVNFAAKIEFTTGSGPFSVSTGDVDGDGKPDLAISNFFSHTVSVLRQLCVEPTIPTLSTTSSTNCGTQSTNLSIATGTLNDATSWQWYSGSCGGPAAGNGTTITVSPTTTTTYFARGEGGCAAAGSCGSITITVNPVPTVGSTVSPSATVCSGTSLTLSGTGATSYSWSGGISNAIAFIGTATTTYTVTGTDANGCTNTASQTITILPHTWTGNTNMLWSEPMNWSCNSVPSPTAEIIIPNTLNKPVLNIDYTVGGSLMINASGSLTVNPNKVLAVTGTANFNDQLVVFKSDATGTGSLGASSGNITGETNVTVERYFPTAGVTTGRSWRLLAIPVTDPVKTIRDAWAGHAANDNAPAGEVGGSGTQITGGSVYGDGATAAAAGYDWWSALAIPNTTSSIRNYTISGSNGGWTATTATATKLDATDQGYMLFIRGDRTVTTLSGPTTLRPNGKIKTGMQSYSIPAPGTAKYKVIGNPYAATISFESLMTNGVNSTRASDDHFWQWDANLGTNGGYRTVMKNGASDWERLPAEFSDPNPSHSEYIFSSQAFIVETLTAGTNDFTITENDKPAILAGTPPSVFDASTAGRFYANLNMDNGGGSLLLTDGVLARFDGGGNNGIDGSDIDKIDNFNENISLIRNNKRLTLEARNLISSNIGNKDTLYFQMSNLTPRNYAFQFKGMQMLDGLTAKLQDLYLGKETVISTTGDITTVNFSVTSDGSSAAADRFRIVFKADPSLPLTLTSAKAYQQNNGIQVDWKTVNELGIKNYEVEKSIDGRSFSKVTTVAATGANSYGWFDAAPLSSPGGGAQRAEGDVYYRIKVIGIDGSISYSSVLKLTTHHSPLTTFAIYPNPAKGNKISIQFSNMGKGKYSMIVYNSTGQKVINRDITHLGGSATEVIDLGSALASGIYRVSLIGCNSNTLNQTLVVQR